MATFTQWDIGPGGAGIGNGGETLREHLALAQRDVLLGASQDIVAGGAVVAEVAAPYDCTVVGVFFRTDDVPSSALGTVVATVTGAANNLLGAANFDLEAQVNGTTASAALTGTVANLDLGRGDLIAVTMTSDNGDMAGGTNQRVMVEVERRAA